MWTTQGDLNSPLLPSLMQSLRSEIHKLCCGRNSYLRWHVRADAPEVLWRIIAFKCGLQQSVCMLQRAPPLGAAHRPPAAGTHLSAESRLTEAHHFAATSPQLLRKLYIPLKNKIRKENVRNSPPSGCVSGSDVACLRSLQVASDQPQNNVIIGVLRLTRLETVIQIRAQGRTRCQSDSSSLRSASKQSELSASAPHLYNFMTWKKTNSFIHEPFPNTSNL